MNTFLNRSRCCALALLFMLVACPSKPLPEYKIASVLPSPVTPGDAVTAFGVFPDGAGLSFNGQAVAVTPVPNGLLFSVPKDAVAGEYPVLVSADGVRLEANIAVNPRVDAAALEGSSIVLSAVGFPTDLVGTKALVNGFALPLSKSGSFLRVDLPKATVYGGLNLSLIVSGRASNVRVLAFEAATLTGKVRTVGALSAPDVQAGAVRANAVGAVEPTDAFLVFHWAQLEANSALMRVLSGSVARESLGSLGVTRFAFADKQLAASAFERLRVLVSGAQAPEVTHLEWDSTVKPSDALDVVSSFAPSGSVVSPGAGQWFLSLQGVPQAWAVTQGQGVTVAVVDTGVALEHTDLQANLLPGYDFVDDDPVAADITGHGTHVAGLVAANGKAMGVAPKAKVLPVRVLRDLTGGSAYTIAQGILWAAGLLETIPNPNPAQVINLSLGSDSYSEVIARAVEQVQAKGVIVVAAAGNSGGAVAYPAALNGVIAVTALAGPVADYGINGGYSMTYQPSYASRGPGTWLAAFGGDLNQDQDKNGFPDGILSTDTTASGYGLRMGTSMASPQVAGLAALALTAGVAKEDVRSLLAATATDLGPRGYDFRFGHGLASGRVALGGTPRMYVVAFEATNGPSQVMGSPLALALVQPDGSYTLNNLPPEKPVLLIAATDANNNGVVAEAGELVSGPHVLIAKAGSVSTLDLELGPSDGRNSASIRVN